MKTRHLLLIFLVFATTTLSACSRAWWLPRPHKIDVQQGNLLSVEEINQVKVGMSRNEVANLLGQPITSNGIDPDRWDYIYSLNRAGETPNVTRLSLDFQDDVVANLETDGFDADDEE